MTAVDIVVHVVTVDIVLHAVTVVDVDIIVHVLPVVDVDVVDVAAVDNFDALVNAYLDVT